MPQIPSPSVQQKKPISVSWSTDWNKPSNGVKKATTWQQQVYMNQNIKAFEVVVINEDGENLGQMKRSQALALAEEAGLDLVQVSYNPVDKVCTAKIIDFGKYMYDKKRATKEKKKTTVNKWMKQIKFAYAIGTNDLLLKTKKISEMLDDGYTVRLFCQLKWRENIHKDKLIEKFMFVQDHLKDVSRTQTPRPKQDKNTFAFIFMANKK